MHDPTAKSGKLKIRALSCPSKTLGPDRFFSFDTVVKHEWRDLDRIIC